MTSTRVNGLTSFTLGLVTTPLLLTGLILAVVRLGLPTLGRWLSQPANAGPADAIIVLGGGGPERTLHGVELFKQHLAPQLWLTGDAPLSEMSSFSDGEFARQFAIEQGVPKEAISLLASTSTWEDGQAIAARASQSGVTRLMVVTDWYHSNRALCVLRRQLAGSHIAVYFSAPPALTYGPDDWWHREDGLVAVSNEYIKWCFYLIHYGLTPWNC